MNQSIIDASEKFVTQLLQEGLTKEHVFHSIQHTVDVRNAVIEIGTVEGISDQESEILILSALFHDVGYTKTYDGHEEESKRIAESFLRENNYNGENIQQILTCIGATKFDYKPQNKLEGIISDADLSNLGKSGYMERQNSLRKEWEIFKEEKYSDKKWRKLNLEFFKDHEFFTQAARDLYNTQKQSNFLLMKKTKEKGRKVAKVKNPLATSKSAQVMFKTALRNHIDLTNLADNKANMMLSINAIIITITMPLLSNLIRDNILLVIPAAILLLTCITSVIFAAIATRPINMTGEIPLETIKQGKGNLFFFGNFYNMSLEDYKKGMREVINNEQLLESSAISDLYYLGAALGGKYNLLRTCYTIFMVGMTLTVVAFIIIRFIIEMGG